MKIHKKITKPKKITKTLTKMTITNTTKAKEKDLGEKKGKANQSN